MSKGHGRAQRWVLGALRADERRPWDRWVPVVDLAARYADEVGAAAGRGAEESIRRAVKRLAGEARVEVDEWYLERPCRVRGVRTPAGHWFPARQPSLWVGGTEEYGDVERERRVLVCRAALTPGEERAERIHDLEERWGGFPTRSGGHGS